MQLPSGFRFAGVSCGIKQTAGKKDVALVVADHPAIAAAVYTQNKIVAAPVVLSRSRTPSTDISAVVVNSGNANACTGRQGDEDARAMTESVARCCEVDAKSVLVMSTGIIGHVLPMNLIDQGITDASTFLGTSEQSFLDCSDAILTTDVARKIAQRTVKTETGEITIAGMAKGAGMIGPNMATMLGLILCDAHLSPADAQASLKVAVARSFNSISVDGHTSTNDTVNLLSSGHFTNPDTPRLKGQALADFTDALTELCIELAKQIPADGEGASHLIEINVAGAATGEDAHRIAKTVADSPLVKTAVTGNDPNWGRIMSAVGYSGVPIHPKMCSLDINDHAVYELGGPATFDEKSVSESMKSSDTVTFKIRVGDGPGIAQFWTSDLTKAYVEFNSEYTT